MHALPLDLCGRRNGVEAVNTVNSDSGAKCGAHLIEERLARRRNCHRLLAPVLRDHLTRNIVLNFDAFQHRSYLHQTRGGRVALGV